MSSQDIHALRYRFGALFRDTLTILGVLGMALLLALGCARIER